MNKNSTITIDSSTPSTGKVNQKIINEIKELSNDPKWLEALSKMTSEDKTKKGRGRSRV